MTIQLQPHDLTPPHFDTTRQFPPSWNEIANVDDFARLEHPHSRGVREPGAARGPRGLSRRALTRACSFIAGNLGERFTLDDLARQAGVSRFHFARLFRVSTGYSPMAYLLKSRIERAKQMLLQDDRPVCEIAAALGFCDQSHLTRTFRRMTGATPREFARQHADVA
jgi:transcriptional regulator GlxA family with amidase domain